MHMRQQQYGEWSLWISLGEYTLGHHRFQFVQVLSINLAGRAIMLLAQRRGHAKHFTHHSGGSLHAHRTERHVRYADVATGHHQVVDVA